MLTSLEKILAGDAFGSRQAEKEQILLPLLDELTTHHRGACKGYGRIMERVLNAKERPTSLAAVPFLPVSIFKFRRLRSVAAEEVRVTVSSSGTTGALRGQVELDAEAAKLSSRALNTIIGSVTKGKRLPMLILDCPAALTVGGSMGARAAAILGMMPFGTEHKFALRNDFSLDHEGVATFLAKHKGQPIFLYGFTYLVWQHFAAVISKHQFDLSNATLLHSGGWKRLAGVSVEHKRFKAELSDKTGLQRVINFYGMAELPGTICLENDDGLLYPPRFADVIIRNPVSLEPVSDGTEGLIQILTVLPRSYPGHSLLTEDLGIIESRDSGVAGKYGKGFRVTGRAPRAEMRGCSDVLSFGAQT